MVSDPCYTDPTWCQKKLSGVKPGNYFVFCRSTDDTGGWGERQSVLLAIHEDHINDDLKFRRTNGIIGVDSGQAGIFSLDTYRKDSVVESVEPPKDSDFILPYRDSEGDAWYELMCKFTLGNDGWGSYPNGVVSRSGYGDGGYDLLLARSNRSIVAIGIDFLVEDNTEFDINFYKTEMV